MKLMIVGSGYVGLVAGACLSELGHEIVCVDRDATKIAGLRAGVLPIFEPGLEELVLRNAAAGRLTFASDLAELNNGVEAVFIAVGTPPSSIDQSADLSSVFAVARDVARASSTGLVIVTKSTVPVGTGDEIADIMRSTAPALRFHVASNPEFLRADGRFHGARPHRHPSRTTVRAMSLKGSHRSARGCFRPRGARPSS